MSELEDWLCKELTNLLGIPEVQEIARQLISLGSRSLPMAQSYADEILGTDPQALAFFERFSVRMQPAAMANSKLVAKASDLANAKGRALKVKYESKKKGKSTAAVVERVECGCFGLDHPEGVLICTICGRIMCGNEGEGECFYCQSKVFRSGTIPNMEFVEMMKEKDNGERNVDAVKNTAKEDLEVILAHGLERAIAQKNKLLEFSRDPGMKKIIDDQEDFYDLDDVDANAWLDDQEREEYERMAEENEERLEHVTKTYRAPVRVTFDLENKDVIQEEDLNQVESKLKDIRIEPKFALPKEDEGKIMRGCSRLDSQAKQVYEQMRAAAADRIKAKIVKAPKKKNKIKVVQTYNRVQDELEF